MKKSFIIILLFAAVISVNGQNGKESKATAVKWLTIQEAEKLSNQSPKPIFIVKKFVLISYLPYPQIINP